MKSKIIQLTLAAAVVLLSSIPQADARSRHSSRIYISGHRSCGTPIYTERYFIGYDHCGNEIWGKRIIQYERRQRYVAPCPPPRHHHAYGTSITFHGSYRR